VIEVPPCLKHLDFVITEAKFIARDFEDSAGGRVEIAAKLMTQAFHDLCGMGIRGDQFEVLNVFTSWADGTESWSWHGESFRGLGANIRRERNNSSVGG
jgi:hypothetical protein